MTHYVARVGGALEWHVERVADDGMRTVLPLRLDLMNHSPSGVAWGYGGSGPAQLALALLADALGDDQRALALYQDFKWATVARLPKDQGWVLEADAIRLWADERAPQADPVLADDLLDEEVFLLTWLAKEDSSAYGECRGPVLDGLKTLGLVTWDPGQDPRGLDYCRVRLTEAGEQTAARLKREAESA